MSQPDFASLSDDDVVEQAEKILAQGNDLTAKLLLLLIQLEDRRIFARKAQPSIFAFCVHRLKMSDSAAARRVNAARVLKKFPSLLPRIESGELGVTLLASLRHHLTDDNIDQLLAARRRDSDVRRRPDARGRMRKIPAARTSNNVTPVVDPPEQPALDSRYRVEVTVGRETRDKIERLRELMIDANPTRDVGFVVESAIDVLLATFENRRASKEVSHAEQLPPALAEATTDAPNAAPVTPPARAEPAPAPRAEAKETRTAATPSSPANAESRSSNTTSPRPRPPAKADRAAHRPPSRTVRASSGQRQPRAASS